MTNILKWDFRKDFTGEEAAYLIYGIDPSMATEENGKKISPILEAMRRDYENAKSNALNIDTSPYENDVSESILNSYLTNWDKYYPSCEFEGIRQELQHPVRGSFENQLFPRNEIVQWLSSYGYEFSHRFYKEELIRASVSEEKLNTKERNTLLGMFYFLVQDKYKDMVEEHNVSSTLEKFFQTYGFIRTDETIREKLQDAEKMLKAKGIIK